MTLSQLTVLPLYSLLPGLLLNSLSHLKVFLNAIEMELYTVHFWGSA